MKNQPKASFWEGAKLPIAVAHRGGDVAGPEKENSMAAFTAAYSLGYRWFETDVVPTKDGKLLAIHGRGFQPNANKDLPLRKSIQRMSYKEAQERIVVGGESAPLLEELLESFPDSKFFVDPKTAKAAKRLTKLLKNRPEDLDRMCVGSFLLKRNWQIARSVKRATGKELCTSILGPASAWPIYWSSKIKFLKPFARQYVKRTHAHSVHVPYSWFYDTQDGKNLVEHIHGLGLKIAAYTPNDEDSIKNSIDSGVDIIISDQVGLLSKLIKAKS
jgi:glycerophosphoryl diester phosphodiesterase